MRKTKSKPNPGRGRNEPCACGSGRKSKLCCGRNGRPAPVDPALTFLAEQRRLAAAALEGVSADGLEQLFAEVLDLPAWSVGMAVELPEVLTPELEALRVAIVVEDDEDAIEPLIGPALAQVDTARNRAALAREVLDLAEDDDEFDPQLLAAAMVDLAAPDSTLLRACLIDTLNVLIGSAYGPDGLLLTSR